MKNALIALALFTVLILFTYVLELVSGTVNDAGKYDAYLLFFVIYLTIENISNHASK